MIERPHRDVILPGTFSKLTTSGYNNHTATSVTSGFEGIQGFFSVAGMRRTNQERLGAAHKDGKSIIAMNGNMQRSELSGIRGEQVRADGGAAHARDTTCLKSFHSGNSCVRP